MFYEFERRAVAFLKRIEGMKPCASRQQAYESLLAHWHAVESTYHDDKAYLDALLKKKMTAENDWHCLEGNPCYWQSPKAPQLRIYVHDDGAIVIQRLGAREGRILFALSSAQPAFHPPKAAHDKAGMQEFTGAVQSAAVPQPQKSLSKM